MEKPPEQKIEQPEKKEDEFNPERIDRLIAVRHKNAAVLAEIEKMLAGEVPLSDYPTKASPEYKALMGRVETEYGKLDIRHNADQRRGRFFNAVNMYLYNKVGGRRQEISLRRELGDQNRDSTAEGLGAYIFEWRTGQENKGRVLAEQREGYFVLFFEKSSEFSHFSKGGVDEADIEKTKRTGGRYHRAMLLPRIGRIRVLIVKGLAYSEGVVLHERQHFFNDVAFCNFLLTEETTDVPRSLAGLHKEHEINADWTRERLRDIKDELLAYIRDGSSAERATGFLDNTALYGHLLENLPEGAQSDIKRLMLEIRKELKELEALFWESDRRAMLVYQLIDVPLIRMPAMLNRMKKFYNKQVRQLTDFMPDQPTKEQIGKSSELEDLYLEITGETYQGVDYIFEEGGDERVKDLRKKLEGLRAKYDALYSQLEGGKE